jgi:hypothetical protein
VVAKGEDARVSEGAAVGTTEGESVGVDVRATEGAAVGTTEGAAVGVDVGATEGAAVGATELELITKRIDLVTEDESISTLKSIRYDVKGRLSVVARSTR